MKGTYQDRKLKESEKCKLIYNPHAGGKRSLLPNQQQISLEDIEELLTQYQIPTDFYPTKKPGHATILAKESIKEGYKMVIAAGGDGTVAETASGLVGTKIPLAILPLGSFMNIARMLSIPHDLEKAIELIKIGRERKIDVGKIQLINGEKLKEPQFFFEEAGIGIEAQVHFHLTGIFERHEYKNLIELTKTIRDFYGHRVRIFLDNEEIKTRATLVTVSNGSYGWGGQNLAPQAKLNDHRLTVRIYRMSRLELTNYLLRMIFKKKKSSTKVDTSKAMTVKVLTSRPRLIHADARVFGQTPVEFEILPEALNVITGFPKPAGQKFLEKRTYLDF